jgi:serine/threonine protein kinase
VNDFEKLNRLGEGTYGVVYRAKDRVNGACARPPCPLLDAGNRVVALKKMRVDERTEGISVSSYREINLLFELKHENIVELYEV